MKRLLNNKAFSLAEIMISAAIAVVLVGAVFSFFYLGNKSYSMGVSGQQLQNDANFIISKIIAGKTEPGGIFRLSEATSYQIVSLSELHFIGTDAVERSLRLNGSSIIYRHPTALGMTDETLYSAPPGAQITLRFSAPSGAGYTGVVIGIDVAIIKNVAGSTLAGSASTYVNIRNHAV